MIWGFADSEGRAFALHQLPDFLERLVERAGGNMGVVSIDRDRVSLAEYRRIAVDQERGGRAGIA
jgi:hypothetical protein